MSNRTYLTPLRPLRPMEGGLDQRRTPRSLPHFLTYPEMVALPKPDWLIKGLLTRGTSALLFGKSNTFKSFLAIDIACSVATGHTWHGQPILDLGPVLYIATEGGRGVATQRIPGWMEAHGIPPEERNNIHLYPQEVALDDDDAVEDLLDACASMRVQRDVVPGPGSPKGAFRLIVVDIFGSSMEGSETDHETARAWVRNLNRIVRAVGCTVLVVAHSGWGDEKRLRGHSHFWGSFDTRLKAEGDMKALTTVLTVDRHKDSDSQGRWGFRLQTVPVPGHEDQTTLVPLLSNDVKIAQHQRLGGQAGTALQALSEALEHHGQAITKPGLPSDPVVTIEQWREHCRHRRLAANGKPEAFKKAFDRAKKGLIEKGLVQQLDDYVWKVDGST
ncbi:AAA family ATPase [Rubellimicrobium mesophilum]|nr:AAA family ATPase [Rubellimicrobium mesophilum]